ncbi:hypothetical protein NLX86_18880 [Streptomyces sp. A3M-1-3]|uniref:hypothetical protein n=1 Tax=Streptomyces sp. A3M-1-3 TaxID=2962044 RepID=UPI0020B899B6|nr:hypothetical protein [Streptomyces sp. A3M-1-3]MCP3820083.1 hypothetical protein [Streptomyces sp. A3M-1-3]
MKLPHLFHRDPNWQISGIFAYHQCRCGARRTVHVARNYYGPTEPGWPEPKDKHGRLLVKSGWRS